MKSSCVPSIANTRPNNFIDFVSLDMSCQDDNRSSTVRILEASYGLLRTNTLLEEEPLLEGHLIQGTFIETNQKKERLKESLGIQLTICPSVWRIVHHVFIIGIETASLQYTQTYALVMLKAISLT